MIEVELKFELSSQEQRQFQKILDTIPGVLSFGQMKQVDRYYDTSTFHCLQQAVFVRIRNQSKLEIKYHEHSDPFHTHATEQVFPLPIEPYQLDELNDLFVRFIPTWQQGETLQEIFARNGLLEFASIEKQRWHYTYGDIIFCLDSIKNLGNFLEVELSCAEEQEVASAEARLRAILAQFGLSSLCTVNIGYVELWLRRHLPQVYYLGKYQLDEDEQQRHLEYSGSLM